MTRLLAAHDVAQAFVAACRLELSALKPGNVHVHASGHGMQPSDFERAAEAAAPHITTPGLPVGTRIRRAVEASFSTVGCNTNLGIVLLCAPLAYTTSEPVDGEALRDRLANVLADLSQNDAAETFKAIARANPGGLGHSEQADVTAPAEITLLQAMKIAADRDRIARAYVTAYADIFEIGLPLYETALRFAETPELAITTLHMHYLSRFPDTHIARKFGPETALHVQNAARALAPSWQPVARTMSLPDLLNFDAQLKAEGINPGTTADFVVATIFTEKLLALLASPSR